MSPHLTPLLCATLLPTFPRALLPALSSPVWEQRGGTLLLKESSLSTDCRELQGDQHSLASPSHPLCPHKHYWAVEEAVVLPQHQQFPVPEQPEASGLPRGLLLPWPLKCQPVGFQQSASNGKQISPVIWEKTTNLGGDCIFCQNKACLLQKPLIPLRLRAFCRGSQQTWLLLLLKSLNLVYREGRGGGERTDSEAP